MERSLKNYLEDFLKSIFHTNLTCQMTNFEDVKFCVDYILCRPYILPGLYSKGLNFNKMMLSENDQIISDETNLADTLKKHFVNITKKSKHKPKETEPN